MQKNAVTIIAEAGVNHNGSLELAKELIDIAVEARADAIKFQTFMTKNVVTLSAPKAKYQIINTKNASSQYEMIKALELSQENFFVLKKYCQSKNILFLSTPFDQISLQFLVNEIDVPIIKMASGEITNGPLLLAAAHSQKPIILSTGMCNLGDIETALAVLAYGYTNKNTPQDENDFREAYYSLEGQAALKENVSLLHCTTEYPAQYQHVNLKAIQTLASTFDLQVGYSDHTLGIEVSIAAVAMGATIIEKHFTLSKELPGPDHRCSLEPTELASLVASIRHIEAAMGCGIKKPMPCELETLAIVRRSLVANHQIEQGQFFNEKNLTAKRPAEGVSPMKYWEYLRKTASKDYVEDEKISHGN